MSGEMGDMNTDSHETLSRLIGLKRHERPGGDHWVGLSRAVRFQIEQERAEMAAAGRRRDGAGRGSAHASWLGDGWTRWLEPSAWVPTVLAVLAIVAWWLPSPVIRTHGTDGSHLAGFGSIPELGVGMDRPKVSPIVGVHVRRIFLDSDQLPEGFVAFPPLPAGVALPGR
ncbi:MAG: hypothetical protein WCR07_03990 [Verrucomicrobiota bacterium]|jgi:hypothetical protein